MMPQKIGELDDGHTEWENVPSRPGSDEEHKAFLQGQSRRHESDLSLLFPDDGSEDGDIRGPRVLFTDERDVMSTSFWARLCRDSQSSESDENEGSLSTGFWKYAYSTSLILFSVYAVMAAILSKHAKISEAFHPFVSIFLITLLIFWLGMMEGGQGCLVGLQPIEKTIYMHSHATTFKCTTIAHKGDNMNRFIVGRQFLVTMVVFVINLCGSMEKGVSISGVPDSLSTVFLGTGFATILMTVTFGQLTPQVNATNCMLDFVNTRFMVVTTWISLAVESSGLLHAVYLVKYASAVFTKNAPRTDDSERVGLFFWPKVLFSSVLLGFATVMTFAAILKDETTMYEGAPKAVTIVVLIILMCFVGLMEGIQIALFAVVNLPENEVLRYPVAAAGCELAFRGSNFQAFLIGRQICVTICTFIVARITTINVDINANEETLFGVSRGMQKFLNTGLPGALVATILASLAWRITASSFPMAFMSFPITFWTIRLCLILEASGICSVAWLLAKVQKKMLGYKLDEVYLGTRSKPDMSVETASVVSSECTDYGATSPAFP